MELGLKREDKQKTKYKQKIKTKIKQRSIYVTNWEHCKTTGDLFLRKKSIFLTNHKTRKKRLTSIKIRKFDKQTDMLIYVVY